MATLKGSQALPRTLFRTTWRAASIPKRYASTAAAIEYSEPEPYIPDVIPPTTESPLPARKRTVRDAKPFSEFLTDTFHRQHDYLRISVTERCNLRCLYCMPEEGIELSPNKDILTSAEIYYLSALFVNQGVNKIRLTGGEPTVRKDIVPLMQQIGSLRRNGLKELALTTNAISLHRKLDAMVEAGLTGVNISLDTLDPFQFQLLTRRQGFDAVIKSINRVQEMNKMGANVKLKINAVVMRGLNDHQILPFVEKTRDEDIEVRFIEYMPFGGNKWSENKMLPYSEMLNIIREKYPSIARLKDAKNDTSKTYQIPGFKGRVGFITSMTHNFCGTCNRLRITSDGNLKVCLHGDTEVSLRDLLRQENNGEPMDEEAFEAIRQIELDRRKGQDLQFDGEEGWMTKEQQLLDVIGAAVKRKKAKHAGMGQLENMKNRPMILIDCIIVENPTSQLLMLKQKTWARIPFHLLGGTPYSGTTVRWYSSSSNQGPQRTGDENPHNGEAASDSNQTTGFASTFGFQSLSGLFQAGERARYNSPPKAQNEEQSSNGTPSSTTTTDATESQHSQPPEGFFRSSSISSGEFGPSSQSTVDASKSVSSDLNPSRPAVSDGDMDSITQVPIRRRSLIRDQMHPPQEEVISKKIFGPAERRSPETRRSRQVFSRRAPVQFVPTKTLPNPFKRRRPDASEAPTTVRSRHRAEPKQPWGLSEEDLTTIDSIAEPSPAVQAEFDGSVKVSRTPIAKGVGEIVSTSGRNLTHVNESGEAHMVDVGAKPASHRVAIAHASVLFSNSEPLQLIFENQNKKGDVLGVSRIAGVMAAKRTSDIIPLCHPVAISKAEVDVKLEASHKANPMISRARFGMVDIFALIECNGPTGIEMEALTAASAAALTVYDMCKAVDRGMRITSVRLVYKSGGRSGLFALEPWATFVGRQFFVERGLEVPDFKSLKESEGGKKD